MGWTKTTHNEEYKRKYQNTIDQYICNKSFSSGLFPSELKIANVVPIF